MSNVTKFPGSKDKPAPVPSNDDNDNDVVLVCIQCGCLSHFINMDQTIQCANCRTFLTTGTSEWRRNLPDDVPDDKVDSLPDTGGSVTVKCLGSEVLARKSVMRNVTKWDKDDALEFVAAYHHDGTGSHWANMKKGEDREWMVDKLTQLLENIKNARFDGE